KAVATIKHVVDSSKCPSNGLTDSILHEEKIRDLLIKVTKDVPEASTKLNGRNDGNPILGLSHKELAKRNLLKGITVDESATLHDTSTLGVVVVRHCGYTAVVKVFFGPGKGIAKRIKKNPEDNSSSKEMEKLDEEQEVLWRKLLPEATYLRLKESGTGLHLKLPDGLIKMAHNFYDEIALPKLVADFGSFELSPVDERTLIDFMHTRGLRMCSLGRVVELSDKLPHVQLLCIYEMVVRAYKHILQEVIAAVDDIADLAGSIASCLNVLLGTPQTVYANSVTSNDDELKWSWVESFLSKRVACEQKTEFYGTLRKFSILRGLCHKVGLELVPRDYDMDSAYLFKKADIISMVPVYKHVACSSADGRMLLDSSKTSFDKDILEDAVNYGTKVTIF
ncbi:protein TSS, partial [Tanacetum coccineum]